MNTISAFQSGLAGIQSGMQSLHANIAEITKPETLQSASGFTEPLVNMMRDELQIEASVNVLEVSSSTIGSIIDLTA